MDLDRFRLVRNPYPVPNLLKEGTWIKGGSVLSKNVCPDERHWYSKLEPHDRLFSHQTLTTARRDSRYNCDKVPNDSLDLILSSVYVHNKDSFLPKPYVTMQPETLNKETWRVLRNEMKIYSKPPLPLGHEIKYASTESKENSKTRGLKDRVRKRIHPSSLRLDMEGPHIDRTNPGYSRKIDGTYYGI
ncbi:PREDICTED: uncharacterized protein C1orf194 [Ceratosolen solmsi marchali]|uniref:Uncharacterized protein C1orf194 n=1 Tax=Ceratosolen solmsi marchali TaxID=326594 RepID=A0AAJ6YNA8_9HYME|nr:PREDICTED: uncharacterized protein C1orf194 [Ceratosolen solmsi marchali]